MPGSSPRQVPQVILRGVHKTYPGAVSPTLVDIDMEVARGEIFGIIGRSGAGKSTLLRLLNRLEAASAGDVVVDDTDLSTLGAGPLRRLRRRIGMVYQHFNLLSVKTVWDNVLMPLTLAGPVTPAQQAHALELLQWLGLDAKRQAYPAHLSGGEKQRAGIARALVSQPDLLLCDEATSALDPETTQSILRLLKEINQRLGLTIVLITHEMEVIRTLCDKVLILDRGRVVEQGEVWQVFGDPQSPVTAQLLGRSLEAGAGAHAEPDERAQVTLRYTGAQHTAPDLASLAAALGPGAEIVQAQLERVQGRLVGEVRVALPAAHLRSPAARAQLHALAGGVEVQGLRPESLHPARVVVRGEAC